MLFAFKPISKCQRKARNAFRFNRISIRKRKSFQCHDRIFVGKSKNGQTFFEMASMLHVKKGNIPFGWQTLFSLSFLYLRNVSRRMLDIDEIRKYQGLMLVNRRLSIFLINNAVEQYLESNDNSNTTQSFVAGVAGGLWYSVTVLGVLE